MLNTRYLLIHYLSSKLFISYCLSSFLPYFWFYGLVGSFCSGWELYTVRSSSLLSLFEMSNIDESLSAIYFYCGKVKYDYWINVVYLGGKSQNIMSWNKVVLSVYQKTKKKFDFVGRWKEKYQAKSICGHCCVQETLRVAVQLSSVYFLLRLLLLFWVLFLSFLSFADWLIFLKRKAKEMYCFGEKWSTPIEYAVWDDLVWCL